MKNLQLFRLSRKAVNVTDEDAKHIAFVNDKVYVLRNNVLTMYEDGPGEEVATITSTSADVIQFEYLTQEQLLWIGAKSEFVCVNLSDKSIKRIESESIAAEAEDLFEFDCAVWNPTKEAFVAIKLNGELCVFEVNFETQLLKKLRVCNLHDALPRNEELGWGSGERQFRSPEELALVEAYRDEEAIPEPDETIKISWRGNAEQFVVNYVHEGKRKIRVFQYPCTILDESENIVGFQAAIAWRPTGNWIAGVIWTTKRCQIAMFEKNCLVKSNYNLAKTAYVQQLKWSPSGEILAVQQGAVEGSYTSIDLYWFNNGTIYLKQRLQFLEVNPLIGFDFLKSPDPLCVLRATTLYEAITYSFKYVYYCSQIATRVHTTCISIDGAKALVTHCKVGMTPPPVCDLIVEVDAPINFITFHAFHPQVAFIDSCNMVTTFEVKNETFTKLQSFQLEGEPGFIFPLKFHQFYWVHDRIFCVGEQPTPQTNDVDVFYIIPHEDIEEWIFTSTATLEKGFNHGGFVEVHQNLLAQQNKLPISGDTRQLGHSPSTPLALTHLHMRSTLVGKDLFVFSLSTDNKFFINDREVLQGVISFIIYDAYLFLTLSEGKLMGVRLKHKDINELIKNNFANVYSRLIELGASLICGIPGTSYLAMQIPRGNVEMCACRLISVDRIEALVAKRNYSEALDVVRLEKLHMNVLIDLNFNRFMFDIPLFIHVASVPSVISEFLLTLEDHNIFNTIYRDCSITVHKETAWKRNLICNAMIKHMERNNHRYYINSIITACFVKNSPTAISEALHYVQSLLDQVGDDPSIIDAAVEAFKSARTIKSSKDMYETALLTYDLDLILFVARNIEMDPLEFEPFIEMLKSLDFNRCRFKINEFLGRRFEAFLYLIRCSCEDGEVLEYVKQHSIIHEKALWKVKPDSSLYVAISRIVGTNLRDENKFEEAATFFHRAKLLPDAFDAYKRGLLWRQAIDVMNEMNWTKAKIGHQLRALAEDLKSAGRMKEASHIYEKHLDDYETAIMVCIQDSLFPRAIKLAQRHHRNDIYESDIVEGVYSHCSFLCDRFKILSKEFVQYKTRLFALRTEKKAKFDVEDDVDLEELSSHDPPDDIASIISTASSTARSSRSTTRTSRSSTSTSSRSSSRSRRRQERKKHSMREGSLYEDIAIMESLYNLIHEAFDWGPKAREICLIVLGFNNHTPRPEVIQMYNLLSDLQAEMQTNIQDIWPPFMNNIDSDFKDIYVFQNVNILDFKYRSPPENITTSWKLDTFPTSNVEV